MRAQLLAPAALRPGQPARLTYRLADATTGAPLTDVVISHEQPVHLIAARRDLQHFQHVHPQPTGAPGEYALDVTFPAPGDYLLFAEFQRAGGQGAAPRPCSCGTPWPWATRGSAPAAGPLSIDRAPRVLPATGLTGGVRVALQGAGHVHAGEPAPSPSAWRKRPPASPCATCGPTSARRRTWSSSSENGATFAHTHGEAHAAGGRGPLRPPR